MSMICVKFRLYPTPAQETKLRHTVDVCREVYNSFLQGREYGYEVDGTAPTEREQEKMLAVWKQSHPELSTVHAHLLQNVAIRVELAFQAFFRRVKNGETPGYPRKKGRGHYDSFTFKEYGNGCKLSENSVTLSKIGSVQAMVHRHVEGVYKTCTIRRQSGKWYVCFAVEVGVSPCASPENEPLPPSEEQVGIDVGLNAFAALSNGEFVANPRFFRKDEKALAKAQRKADKFKHARNKEQKAARRKAYKVVSRIHERIRNRRHDFVHQLSRKLVNRFGLIAVEKLNVKNMSKSPAPKQDAETGEYLPNGASAKAGLNKSILDAAWSMFRFCLAYKAESAGRKYTEVNPAYTSQDCSGCGYRAKKKLSERWHFCPNCGLSLDRDTNAALNILKIGMGLHTVSGIPA
jgi:putative transposase